MVRADDLSRRIGAAVTVREDGPPHEQLFTGKLSWQRLRSGLSLHCSDCVELHDFSTQVEVGPRLSFVLFMAGGSEVRYDDRSLQVASRPGQPQGIAVALTEPAIFTRRARRGQHIRKLSLCMSPEWFESSGMDSRASIGQFIEPQQHMAMHRWTPTPAVLALSETILSETPENTLLARLQQESRALDLAQGVLQQLVGQTHPTPRQRPHQQRLVQRTLDLLHSNQADGWSLDEIATAVGASASTLQRQFRIAQGQSLFAFQRQRKLQQARRALQNGLSIREAAWLAGYSGTANFTTAFRREFGVTPQVVQKFF
ncbi:AraC family transcriptional regulator [Halopseudomonas litoralis]|nr:AraC family transcriptional regulator [Halopseudomonas litoralis]